MKKLLGWTEKDFWTAAWVVTYFLGMISFIVSVPSIYYYRWKNRRRR